jgi:hypothetical protein
MKRPDHVAEGSSHVTEGSGHVVTEGSGHVAEVGHVTEGSGHVVAEGSDLYESDFDNDNDTLALPISYESLSLGFLGDDFSNFFANGYASILVRTEYRDMLKHILNLFENDERGVVVTGTPGIGENKLNYFQIF